MINNLVRKITTTKENQTIKVGDNLKPRKVKSLLLKVSISSFKRLAMRKKPKF